MKERLCQIPTASAEGANSQQCYDLAARPRSQNVAPKLAVIITVIVTHAYCFQHSDASFISVKRDMTDSTSTTTEEAFTRPPVALEGTNNSLAS